MSEYYKDENKPKFTTNPNEQFWWYRGLELSEDDILRSMQNSKSCLTAAQFLGVSYKAWKKYAKKYRDQITGKTLFETQKEKGRLNMNGPDKVITSRKIRKHVENIFTENRTPSRNRLKRLKSIILEHKLLKHKCNRCGYEMKRIEDDKAPVMLHFRNNNKTDWRIENLEFVCYNCSFVYGLDFFKESMIENLEATPLENEAYKQELQDFTQLDDFYLDFIKQSGVDISELDTSKFKPSDLSSNIGNEFIDRL
jgi:hypothetical protein